ncbi:MAG: hypothetical protein KF687_11455 [Cyclobacteriaceae bacterium]|nr:hypothetical protein [Cyclobacteriaceae bacterium]
MKRFVNTIVLMYTGAKILLAQLPSSSASVNLSGNESASVVVSPVIWKDRGPTSLLAAAYQISHRNRWKYFTEVSGIERFNTSGVTIPSRGKHISLWQSVGRTIHLESSTFTSIALTASAFLIWDEQTLENVTRQWDVEGSLQLKNGSSLSVSAQQRWDRMKESISLGDCRVRAGDHSMNVIVLRYLAPVRTAFVPYVEAVAGTYYGCANRYSFRVGERFKVSRSVSGFADLEFSHVASEQTATGFMSRLKLDWTATKALSTGFFLLNNSFSHFNGVLTYVQFLQGQHCLRVEYREMRDKWRWVESTHPFFSSHVLVQYSYSLTKKQGNM